METKQPIFISYSHTDEKFVSELLKRLTVEGFRTWHDANIPIAHDDWREEIDEKIDSSLFLLLVMSPKANASSHVLYEWAYALGSNKKILMLMLKETNVHVRLSTMQRVNYHENHSMDEVVHKTQRLYEDLEKQIAQNLPAQKLRANLKLAVAELILSDTIGLSALTVFSHYDLLSIDEIIRLRDDVNNRRAGNAADE